MGLGGVAIAALPSILYPKLSFSDGLGGGKYFCNILHLLVLLTFSWIAWQGMKKILTSSCQMVRIFKLEGESLVFLLSFHFSVLLKYGTSLMSPSTTEAGMVYLPSRNCDALTVVSVQLFSASPSRLRPWRITSL